MLEQRADDAPHRLGSGETAGEVAHEQVDEVVVLHLVEHSDQPIEVEPFDQADLLLLGQLLEEVGESVVVHHRGELAALGQGERPHDGGDLGRVHVAQARGLGIPLATFAEHQRIDLTIDGADEVQRGALGLIKGLGGALLWEKIVAANSARMTVMVDESKLVDRLGERCRLPVEVVPFGWQATAARLRRAGLDPALRGGDDPYRTDSGNLLLDCAMAPVADPEALEGRLKAITGVVDTGFFIGIATRVIVGTPNGPQVLQRA